MSVATDMVDLYTSAEKAILNSQSYTLNGRSLTRANLAEIRSGRAEWESRVAAESAATQGGSRLYSLAEFTE